MRSSRTVWLAAGVAALALCGAALWRLDTQPGSERSTHSMRSLTHAAREAGDTNPQSGIQHKVGAAARPEASLSVPQRLEAPEGPAPEVIARLTRESEAGDAQAGLLIFLKLERCQEALDERIDAPRMAVLSRQGVDISGHVQALQRRLADCEGLSGQAYRDKGKWLELSADRGDLGAQLIYASYAEVVVGDAAEMLKHPENIVRYKRKALAFMESAAAKGSVPALLSLTNKYANGVTAPRDPVKTYAYYQTAMRIEARNGRDVSSFHSLKEAYSAQLSPAQRAQANAMADDLYTRCCSR